MTTELAEAPNELCPMAEASMAKVPEALPPISPSGSQEWTPARNMAMVYAMCGTGLAEDASDRTARTDMIAGCATARTMAQQPVPSDPSADCHWLAPPGCGWVGQFRPERNFRRRSNLITAGPIRIKTKIATVPPVMPSQARALLPELWNQFWFIILETHFDWSRVHAFDPNPL